LDVRKGTTQYLVSYLPVGLALLLRGAFFSHSNW